MFKNNPFKNPVRWAHTVVGTRCRFAIVCVMGSCTGAMLAIGIRLLVRVVQTRAEAGLPVMPLEHGLFALLVAGILTIVVWSIMLLIALRGLLLALKDRR